MARVDVADQPLPEAERLRVRVVDTKEADAACDPEEHHLSQRGPQRISVVGVEVERIDVLIALRGVLCVAHGAVGAMTEPRRVLANPGMVGARLQRIVERDLQPRAARFREEQLEVVDGPQVGVHRRVASFRCADRPGAARVVRPAFERIVAALAMRSPDRMDRGEVDDVEAHGGDRGQALRGGAERAAPGRPGALRARKHLVPGGEARPLAVHPNGERAGDGRPAPVCGAPHQRDHLGALRLVQTSARGGTGAELARKDDERALVGRRDTFPVPALGHDRALLQVQAGVLAGLDPDAEVA